LHTKAVAHKAKLGRGSLSCHRRRLSTEASSALEPRYAQSRLCSRQIVVGGSVEVKITQWHVVRHDGALAMPQTRMDHGAGELVRVDLLAPGNDVKFFVREQAEVTSDVCIHVHLLFAK
jgi:hypothetical protein